MDLDSLWVAFAAALVMLMQAGFLCLEAGFVRERHAEGVALKNLVDWVLSNLIFFAIGFGLMFGESFSGIVGSSLFALHGLAGIDGPIAMNGVFFLFQLGFAGTSATIVSGAIAGRVSVLAYLCSTIVIATLVYPVIGHWAWGNALIGSNEPWLASLGFIDFAGSTVVHGSGAWFALVAAHSIGPRRGRFDARGEVRPIPGHSIALATLGVLLLWFGWWGFNGGSTLRFDARVASIIVNTNLAGAAGALVAFVHRWRFQDGRDLSAKLIGGTLGGLVSVTASCHLVSPLGAVFVGAVGGWVHNLAFEFLLRKLRIDDPVGAVAVHGFCGVWGTLAVALVVPVEQLEMGRLAQLAVQATGVGVCFAWSSAIAFVAFAAIRRTIGVRLSPEQELGGVDASGRILPVEVPFTPAPETPLDEATLRALLQGDRP
jgi:Amt family ammonium transporter